MQSIALSMTSTRFEATSQTKRNSATNGDAASALLSKNIGNGGTVSGNSAYMSLDTEGLKKGLSKLRSYLDEGSYRSNGTSLQNFQIKIRSMSLEVFTEQSGINSRYKESVSFSYTEIEISRRVKQVNMTVFSVRTDIGVLKKLLSDFLTLLSLYQVVILKD
jgi:hypothetical protein